MRRTRLLQAGTALVGAAVGVRTAQIAYTDPWPVFGGISPWGTGLGLVAGGAVLTAGVIALGGARTRAAGGLLAASGLSWLLSAWDDPELSSWAFLVGRLVRTSWPVLLSHALLRMHGRLRATERAVLAIAYGATLGVDGVATTALFDPASNGCAACPTNALLLADAPGAAAVLEDLATLAGPVWALLLLAALARRFWRSSPAQRRSTGPVSALGAVILVLVAGGYAQALDRGFGPPLGLGPPSAPSALLLLLALATGWPALALALTRRRLAGLVVAATTAPPVGGLGRVLGRVLHDTTTRLLYPRHPGSEELVDAMGERAEPRALLTPLARGTDTVAYLDHHSPLLPGDGATVAQVARLSLDHERLHAERNAQLRELRESRVRIVAAADRERRRLERDLHDGAQQQLVALALALRLAAMTGTGSAPADPGRLARAEAEVAAALAELRGIARGLYPRELADEGLESALQTFAEGDPTPLTLDLDLPCRLPAEAESAAFFAVVRLLSTPTYEPKRERAIRGRVSARSLELELHGDDRLDLVAIEDRVGAVGGSVEHVAVGRVRIELPCES